MEDVMKMKEEIVEIKMKLHNRWYSTIILLMVTLKNINIFDPMVPETLE